MYVSSSEYSSSRTLHRDTRMIQIYNKYSDIVTCNSVLQLLIYGTPRTVTKIKTLPWRLGEGDSVSECSWRDWSPSGVRTTALGYRVIGGVSSTRPIDKENGLHYLAVERTPGGYSFCARIASQAFHFRIYNCYPKYATF